MKRLFITLAAMLMALAASIMILNSIKLTYTSEEYPETAEYLDNPYCGFYHIYGYVLKDETAYATPADVPNIPDPETTQTVERLVQIQINLCRFKEQPLTDLALSQLDTILTAWCETDYSLLLRFIYDWDGNALEAEPDHIEQILQHMEQTAQVYNKYADHIFMLQGLSLGNNGEMHHTNYGSPEDMQRLAVKLAEVSAPSIYLSVRTPNQWRCITGADSYEELAAMPESPFLGRLGLFNDGMFGTDSDTGTYVDRSRAEEIAFQDALCQTVPNGGEAIIDNPFNDLENAVADMRLMHVSYLNSVHDPAVLNKWKESVYSGNDVFDGCSGYEYIRNHLGYRYVLRSSDISYDRKEDRRAFLTLSIENAGFSGSYRSFSFLLTLVNTETGETLTITPDYDSRCLSGGEVTALSIPLEVEDYSAGTYELYWQTVDDTFGEPILYGNALPLTDKGYLLGTLVCDKPQK